MKIDHGFLPGRAYEETEAPALTGMPWQLRNIKPTSPKRKSEYQTIIS
jgi:hypothetical protein